MDQLFASLLIARHYTPLPVDLLILGIGLALVIASAYRLAARRKVAPPRPAPVLTGSTGGGWVSTDQDFFGASSPAAVSTSTTGFTAWTPPTMPAGRALPTVTPTAKKGTSPVGAVVLVIVGTLITLVGLTAFVPDVADAMSSQSVTLPQQTPHLVQIPLSAQLQQAVSSAESSLPQNVNIKNIQFGLYAKPGQQLPYAVAVVADVVGTPNVGREFSILDSTPMSPSLVKVNDPGHPGELRCGQMTAGTNKVNVCLWMDEDTVGMLLAVDPSLGIQGLTDLGREFRGAAEH